MKLYTTLFTNLMVASKYTKSTLINITQQKKDRKEEKNKIQISNMEIVKCCQSLFGCDLPGVLLTKRYDKFIDTMTNLS